MSSCDIPDDEPAPSTMSTRPRRSEQLVRDVAQMVARHHGLRLAAAEAIARELVSAYRKMAESFCRIIPVLAGAMEQFQRQHVQPISPKAATSNRRKGRKISRGR